MSLLENWLGAEALSTSVWFWISEDQREEYRDSGQTPQRTAWLEVQMVDQFVEALVDGQLIALGVDAKNPDSEVQILPISIFGAGDLRVDRHANEISALGRRFIDVRVLRSKDEKPPSPLKSGRSGRPSIAPLIPDAGSN